MFFFRFINLNLESPAIKTTVDVDWSAIIEKAKKRALGSGGAGAVAMVVQVCSLMWMRTIMNYQVGNIPSDYNLYVMNSP